MTLDELQAKAEKDLTIDDTELDLESLKTPQLHSQYLKTYSTYALMLKKAEGDYSKLHIKKWLFFTGKAEPQEYKDKNFDLKVLRQDVDKFIDSDDDIIKQRQKVEYLKQICNYCEQTLKQINNRTFQIKNAIEWKKFTMGSM
jgi:hypothetical protein|tara:strand:+ start:589 stop:1017 length:429 start_codon:yes stop_codon:yes gene_type:complete